MLRRRVGQDQLSVRPNSVSGAADGLQGEMTTTAPLINIKGFREPELRQMVILQANVLILDGLIYGRCRALPPNHERARTVLALPIVQGVPADRAIERRIRNIVIEHAHNLLLPSDHDRSGTIYHRYSVIRIEQLSG